MDKSVFANKQFLFILFTGFLSVLGIGLIIPVMPFIVGKYVDPTKLNQIAWYVGLLTSLYSFCQFFAAPVLGALSDKYGRRPILLLCLLGSAIGYLMFGIGGSLTVLFIGRTIDGLTGGDISTVMAYIADVTKPQERGKYFGVVGATVGLGFILGPSIGGLVSKISLSAPLYLAAGLTLLNMVYGYFVLPESLSKDKRTANFSLHHLNPFTQMQYILKNDLFKQLMFIGFFYYLTLSSLSAISSVFLKDTFHWSAATIGIFFLILGACDMFNQGFLSGKLISKFGVVKIVLAGFVIVGIAFFLNALVPIFTIVILEFAYIIIYSIGSGLFEPAFGGLVSGVADPHEQGRVQGASQSVQSVTRIVGPLLAAFLYQFSHSLPWVSCVIFSFIGAYLLIRYKDGLAKHLRALSAADKR